MFTACGHRLACPRYDQEYLMLGGTLRVGPLRTQMPVSKLVPMALTDVLAGNGPLLLLLFGFRLGSGQSTHSPEVIWSPSKY